MQWDVVVAGAGPTGLMLACELRLHGASVLVVERLEEPDTTIKAGAVNVPTLEAFRRRGLLPEVAAVQDGMLAQLAELRRQPGQPAPDLAAMRQQLRRIGGHFGGLFVLDPSRLDPADPDLASTDGQTVAVIPQSEVERILAARAAQLGVPVRRSTEVTAFHTDPDGITIDLTAVPASSSGDPAAGSGGAAGGSGGVAGGSGGAADGAGSAAGGSGSAAGTVDRVRARYLVGCDGGRSRIRRLAGFEFVGTEPTITGHQALVTLDHPERLPTGWNRSDVGMFVHGPQPGRILTVEFDGPPADRDAPITREELETSLRHVSGVDVRITEVRSATRFTDNARQATGYRAGRVLLAGDAAHVHSPFGGQGLNLGIGDAVNLGWKLAAVARGRADADLLDTYTAERHPIGARVLELTRAQVALMRPGPLTSALRDVVAELLDTPDGNAHLVKTLGGFLQRYDLGGGHPLVGALTPVLDLADGTTLAAHCEAGGAVLLDLADSAELRHLAGDRARVVTAKADTPLTGLLVRPDGYVAWAAEDNRTDGLADALARWC